MALAIAKKIIKGQGQPAVVYFLSPCIILQTKHKILAFFGPFDLVCCEFEHFLVYFYRLKKCGGVPKLTNIRYVKMLGSSVFSECKVIPHSSSSIAEFSANLIQTSAPQLDAF